MHTGLFTDYSYTNFPTSILQEICTKRTLVITNISNTLCQPLNTMCQRKWRRYVTHIVSEIFPDPVYAKRVAFAIEKYVCIWIPKVKVFDETAKFIKQLQKQNIPVLAITAKSFSEPYDCNYGRNTYDTLELMKIKLFESYQSLGRMKVVNDTPCYAVRSARDTELISHVKMEIGEPSKGTKILVNTPEQLIIKNESGELKGLKIKRIPNLPYADVKMNFAHFTFFKGIIFTDGKPLDSGVKHFVKNLCIQPKHIVVLQNSTTHKNDFENVANALQIPVTYLSRIREKKSFDPDIGTIQFIERIKSGKNLTDEEALNQKNASVDYKALLKKQIQASAFFFSIRD